MARKLKTSSEESIMQVDTVTPTPIEPATDANAYLRSRCGGALRQAREAQALSVQDVASKLRLSPKQIEAIETDSFAKLPEPTIVRGFIRNYAKLLKINAEPLLDAYTVIVPSNTPYELTIKPTSNMHVSTHDKPKTSSYIWAGLAALLAVGLWLFYQNYIEKPSPTTPSATSENGAESLEALPEPALPAAERAPELQPSTELVLPPAADATGVPVPDASVLPAAPEATSNLTPNPVSTIAPVVSAPVTSTPAITPVAASTEMSKLEINASQETWISILDADGKQVYDKIIFAGSRETVEGKPPLSVVVGNASGASLNLNGKPVDLGPHTRNNVARIKLE
jgi:cytoskeleton protein RodZ